jgi:hypothetical protein
MATYWDEGLQTSIYRLEVVAAKTNNPDFVARAKDLEDRLKSQWVPMFSSFFIKGDAIKLGQELAAATGLGSGDPPNTSVLYDEDDTLGGRVGTIEQEAFVSGDIGAGFGAAAEDVRSSASELATSSGHALATYGRWLVLLLAVLVVFYVYERAKR